LRRRRERGEGRTGEEGREIGERREGKSDPFRTKILAKVLFSPLFLRQMSTGGFRHVQRVRPNSPPPHK